METYWLEQIEADLPAQDDWLSSDEAVVLGRMRFAKRRTDWKLGRWTAKRAAAAYLDLPGDPHTLREIEVRPAPSGAPELFVADRPAAATISISHRGGVAVCGIAGPGVRLGCDLELIEPRDDSFVADYFTGEEQDLIAHLRAEDRPQLVTLLWSAKESALKAMNEGLRADTRSLVVTFDRKADPQHMAEELKQHSGPSRWCPLQVCYAGSEVFYGWWQSAGGLVRTVVGVPSLLAPLFLKACAPSARSGLVTV